MKSIMNLCEKLIVNSAVILLMVMVGLVLTNVLLRYLFEMGIPWSEEGARICFVWVVFLGIIIAARDKEHLIVDILTAKLGKSMSIIFGAMVKVITMLVMLSVGYGGWQLAELTLTQPLPATELSTALIYAPGIIGSVALIILTITDFISEIKSIRES